MKRFWPLFTLFIFLFCSSYTKHKLPTCHFEDGTYICEQLTHEKYSSGRIEFRKSSKEEYKEKNGVNCFKRSSNLYYSFELYLYNYITQKEVLMYTSGFRAVHIEDFERFEFVIFLSQNGYCYYHTALINVHGQYDDAMFLHLGLIDGPLQFNLVK